MDNDDRPANWGIYIEFRDKAMLFAGIGIAVGSLVLAFLIGYNLG